MSAPHLPPKSCNIKTHTRLLALPTVLLLIGLSLLSGTTAAIMTVTWIIPPYEPNQFVITNSGRSTNLSSLDPVILNQTRQRALDVYDTSKNVSKDVYSAGAFLGHAMILSSDGWSVASFPYHLGKEKTWVALDYQGVPHHVERVVVDSVTGLSYIKFSGEGFRIAPFAGFDALSPGTNVWSIEDSEAALREDNIRLVSLTPPARSTDTAIFTIGQPEYLFGFMPSVGSGNIVLNDRGELIGFASANNQLIPGWLLQGALSSLLSSGKVNYSGLALDGVMVGGYNVGGNVRVASGFYVSRVRGTALTALLKKGDIILRINGSAVEPEFLSRDILLGSDTLTLTVWRGGAEEDLVVKKTVTP
jgi:hypothetical protein